MTLFVSPMAKIKGHIQNNGIFLGKTLIDSGTLIGNNVIIGHPINKKYEILKNFNNVDLKKIDEISNGSKIGKNCIIRSGTIIYEDSILHNQVRTGHNVLIREGSTIGERTLVGTSSKLDGTVKIGNNVVIQSNVYLPHLSTIEDNVFIAPNVCFTNDRFPPSKHIVGVFVEKNAVIGANATLISGIKIGKNAVIGAGSVVTKEVRPNSVVWGNPAKSYMTRKEYDLKRTLKKK